MCACACACACVCVCMFIICFVIQLITCMGKISEFAKSFINISEKYNKVCKSSCRFLQLFYYKKKINTL